MPEIEAIATDELAAIEAAGMATVIPTARAAQLTMNREGIRRLAAEELGLPTSPYAFASRPRSWRERRGPDRLSLLREAGDVLLRQGPVLSSRAPEQIADAWRYALEGGRVEQARVIVEGRIDFDFEITLLTVRSLRGRRGAHRLLRPDRPPAGQGRLCRELAAPGDDPRRPGRGADIAGKVTDALGGLGMFGVELFVKGDEVWFSEVTPRPHDTGLVTLATQTQSEFALHARAILGLPVDVSQREPGASAVIYGGMDAQGIAFEGVGRGPGRAGRRPAPVRQARELRAPPHGRGAGPGRRHGPGPRTRPRSRLPGEARQGLAANHAIAAASTTSSPARRWARVGAISTSGVTPRFSSTTPTGCVAPACRR